MKAFGPIPSRRLGRSLGINNIPHKTCSYSCIYCQVGKTDKMRKERSSFYDPQEIARDVQAKVSMAQEKGERIDYLSFVPDGEPTLDINLGREIDLLRPLGIKIAVLTNGSLIWRKDVREDLSKADWVSLKVDSVLDKVWRTVNRPHQELQLQAILDGMLSFARSYNGTLVTESMLVGDVAANYDNFHALRDFLSKLNPSTAYLLAPTRPPAESYVKSAHQLFVDWACHFLKKELQHVVALTVDEGNDFSYTHNIEDDLLSVTAVHPMREAAVHALLSKAHENWSVIQRLVDSGKLKEVGHGGEKFYMRNFKEN